MKKLILKNLDLTMGNRLSVEETTNLLGGAMIGNFDPTIQLCKCNDRTVTPAINGKCPCWCIPCML